MIKHAPKSMKPALLHLTKIKGKHNIEKCKKCQKATDYFMKLITERKCPNCGKKLTTVEWPYTFKCEECNPDLILSIG